MSDPKRKIIDEIIESFDVAMLTTRSLEGELRARPMHLAGRSDEDGIYFTSRAEDEKLQEILHAPEVAVTMQGDGRYLSISGHARLETDTLLAEKLWSPTMRAWFPDGPGDNQLTVIEVTPQKAEVWDRTGLRRLEFWWKMGVAVAKREVPDDQDLSGHGKVEFEEP